jgi:hypothetical protein
VPVTLTKNVATLTGVVTVDDAEPLARWLRETARPKVRLSGCTHLHTAALQALLVARPAIAKPPSEPFLARWITPLLAPVPAPVTVDEEDL